jgi:anti-anti-sigma factor
LNTTGSDSAPLAFDTRHVGEVTVVTCTGAIVYGGTDAFETHLDALIAVHPSILLHLGDVTFIDSAGLGLLVRYLTRAQNASGRLRICAVSSPVDRALTVTRLKPVLQPFEDEHHAIADAHRGSRDELGAAPILCVHESQDVLAYLRQLLRQEGYRTVTAANVPDALILLSATGPRVVVVGHLAAAHGTRAADEFRRRIANTAVVELPGDFSHLDAADAAKHVLAALTHLAGRR